jgi:hypothetical protein
MILTIIDLDPLIRLKPNKGTLRIRGFYRWAKDRFAGYGSWMDDLEFAGWLLGLCILAAALLVRRCVQDLVLRSIRLFRTQ